MADTIITMTSPEGATLNTAGTYCEGDIEVVPKLQSKTATTGEIVTADAGYVGLESVDTNPAFEAGKKSEYDAFWDAFASYKMGNRTFAGSGWNANTFRPNVDININTDALETFRYSRINVDLVEHAKKLGINITFNFRGRADRVFGESLFTRLPVIDASEATELVYIFFWCRYLHTIDKFIAPVGTATYLNILGVCDVLAHLIVEGTIGQNGFNVSWSPLDKASLTSIVNALSDTTTGLTVTLRLAAVNDAFETAQGSADGSSSEDWLNLIATKSNWTINLINS